MSEPFIRLVRVAFNSEGILTGGDMQRQATDPFGRLVDGPLEPIAGAMQPGMPFTELIQPIEAQLVGSVVYYKKAFEDSQENVELLNAEISQLNEQIELLQATVESLQSAGE